MRLSMPAAAATAIIAMLIATPIAAHHGWSDYDASKPVTVTGPVTASVYKNPHAMVKMKDGAKELTIMLAPVARMKARKVTADMLAAGKTITVHGLPLKTDPAEIRAEKLTIDGKTYEIR